jgi:hypothetical protein
LAALPTDPVTGRPLATSDLIKLNFFKTPSGTYADPVTFKPFTPHTHIVFIASSGNVFAYDSIERLCIKTKSWRDLIDDSVFKREDIVTIQVRLSSFAIDPLGARSRWQQLTVVPPALPLMPRTRTT